MPTWEVAFRGTWNEATAVACVRHYDSATTPGNVPAVIEGLGTAFKNAFESVCNPLVSWEDISFRNVEPGSVGFSYTPEGWPFPGTQAGAGMPPFVAFGFNLFGTALQAPYRGYARIPGVNEENSFQGKLIGSILVELDVARAFFTTPIGNPNPLVPVIWSRETGATNPVVRVALRPDVTTQNSRKLGRGA